MEAFKSGSFEQLNDAIEKTKREGYSSYQLIEQV
jgi:hypothetical protein